MKRSFLPLLLAALLLGACTGNNNKTAAGDAETGYARDAILVTDSAASTIPLVQQRLERIKAALAQPVPVLLPLQLDSTQAQAARIAMNDKQFGLYYFDEKTHTPFRNEIFTIYPARPQDIPNGYNPNNVYRVELYNYALNLTTVALTDLASQKAIRVTHYPHTQPDLNPVLTELAMQIAINAPEVIRALGYKPEQKEAMMAATKTALNRTRCERSLHLCVAPTFTKDGKALWAIVDLTDHRVVGVRWTSVGNNGPAQRISERKLLFEKIMECNCKEVKHLDKNGWKMNYVITSSDGLRISEVYYQDKLVLNNAKLVDWHVSYSGTDGFGYSDAVGCPEFSQAAVVAASEPKVSELVQDGKTTGFVLEQMFQSEQWPMPCNYNYVQRYEFYNDGRFRIAAASYGRGCGNNGTYRPVTRISFAGNQENFSEWKNNSWQLWNTEQWQLQNPLTAYTQEGYQYKITDGGGHGYYMEPGTGQFKDGGRGDNAYVYVTKLHADKDEGESDLVTIGPCCNTDYRQGPEKFIEPSPENIQNSQLVIWYVAQMKNDDTKGREYCWVDSYLENGVYKTHTFPCFSGPMFIPVK
ncbi:MAG: hypothetical protein U0X40_09510 [Ferruginibacter sp.]